MSKNSNNELVEREIYPQRRSMSVGEPASSNLPDEPTTKYEQYIQPDDHDGYICTPLPRTNQRPTAATCWLVIPPFTISSPSPPHPRVALFPARTEENARFSIFSRIQFCFFIID